MSEPFIGQIWLFAGSFAPRGNAWCDGQLIQVAQNPALYSVLGIQFGGDGRSTFGLPDLRGRAPLHAGRGPGLSQRYMGEKVGYDSVSLTTAQLAGHGHALAAGGDATQAEAANAYWGTTQGGGRGSSAPLVYGEDPTASLDQRALASVGGGQSHENRQPFLNVPFVIALEGMYPSRN